MGSIGTGGTPSKPRNGGLSGLPAVCSRSNRNYQRCLPAPTRFHPCGGTTRAGRRAFLSFPFVGEMARRGSEQKHAAARFLISRGPWFSTIREEIRAASLEKRKGGRFPASC